MSVTTSVVFSTVCVYCEQLIERKTDFFPLGISLILYLGTMKGLLGKTVTRTSPRARRFFAIYSTIMFLLLTADVAVNAIWSQLCWINGRELPLGSFQFIVENTSVWYQTFGSTTVVAMIFMGDALLVSKRTRRPYPYVPNFPPRSTACTSSGARTSGLPRSP